MSVRHLKSSMTLKSPRWAFHHGAGRMRRTELDAAPSQSVEGQLAAEGQPAQVVDAGDGGLVAPDLAGSSLPDRIHQPPPRDYSRPPAKLEALADISNMRDEDGAGGPLWAALLGSNTSEAMRRFIGLMIVFIVVSALFFWLIA